jgi:predicted RNase H-like HicB family nuclease
MSQMTIKHRFTLIIERENELYVALCPELDIATQGHTIEEACANLQEVLELFFEVVSLPEIEHRIHFELDYDRKRLSRGTLEA